MMSIQYTGGSVDTIKENGEALVVASKGNEVEVNAGNIKHKVMSRDQDAGRSPSIKIGKSAFERLEELKYLGKNITNQNSIQEEIRSRMKSRNACNHSVQNFCLPICYPKT